MATIRLTPSTYYLSNKQYLSVSNASNMYNNTDNTTYATVTNTQSGTSSYYIYIRGFNFDAIPSGAIVNSFTIKLKARESGVSTSDSYKPYLANDTTTINGSCNVITTTAAALTFSGISANWETIKNYGSNFGIRINCRRASRNTTGYMYIYGAEIEVDYTIPIYHQITSVSNTDLVQSISPEGTTTIQEGDNYTLDIYTDNINDIIVEDNGADVTNQLVRKENTDTGGTINAVALSNYDTEFSSSGAQFYASGSNSGPVNGILAIGYTAESPNPNTPTGTGVGNYMYVKDSSGDGTATGSLVFNFDFSDIPENAIIESVSISAYGCQESDSGSSDTDVCKLGAYSGNILKGSEQDITRTSNGITTMSNVGTWTRQELQNAKLKFTVGYYGGRLGGITWSVTYSIPSASQYYWQYTLNNVNDDHTIYVMEAVVIPPEEDPEKTYHSLTISSINATTNPGKGTTRVESGTNNTITITPSDPQLTLAIDNGVDITSQLVQHGSAIQDPTVATAPDADYGFNLNSSTGYYVSTNNGISKSASVARITFNLPVRCLVTIQYINYAEEGYDYGMFGKVDTAVATDGLTASSNSSSPSDSTSNYQLAMASNSSSPQTITYEIPSGEHFIDIKYGKDDASDAGNDSLQWKITSIEPLESNNYYTYDLTNISQDHSLIFIFGDVTYYFVNSSTNSDCTLYPSGQMVQLPGDSYRLTIVPENNTDTVTLTDNNTDRTSQLERKEVTTEKNGQTITVVNYIYRLSDIQATHNLVIVSVSQGLISSIKLNNQWNDGALNMKQDSRWGTLQYSRIWVYNGTAWIENAQRTISTKGIIFNGEI